MQRQKLNKLEWAASQYAVFSCCSIHDNNNTIDTAPHPGFTNLKRSKRENNGKFCLGMINSADGHAIVNTISPHEELLSRPT